MSRKSIVGASVGGDMNADGDIIVHVHPNGPNDSDGYSSSIASPSPICYGVYLGVNQFYGRDAKLDELERDLRAYLELEAESTTPDQNILVTGMGGVGKSEFVRRVMGRLSRQRPSVAYSYIWINCNNAELIEKQFRIIARKYLTTRKAEELAIKECVEAIYETLSDKPIVIIFDNAKDKKSIKEFFPETLDRNRYQPLIIATSRNRDYSWKIGCGTIFKSIIELDVFEKNESMPCMENLLSTYEHFNELVRDPKRELVPNIVSNICDHLPIGMQQAAKFLIDIVDSSFQEFHYSNLLEKFDTEEELFLKSVPLYCSKEHEDEKNPVSLFNLFENVGKIGKHVENVLEYLACLYPQEITMEILEKIFLQCNNKFNTKKEWQDTLVLLQHNCLIDKIIKKGHWRVHKLVQNVILFRMGHREKLELLKNVRCALNSDDYEAHRENPTYDELYSCIHCKHWKYVKSIEDRMCLANSI